MVSGLLFVLLRDVDRLSAVEEVLSLYVAGHLHNGFLYARLFEWDIKLNMTPSPIANKAFLTRSQSLE